MELEILNKTVFANFKKKKPLKVIYLTFILFA